ncbi:UNVERIFIED_ORG: formylglycine-generating enzyme required for sulfatase activity [Buttiauxella agrestis ATCC 33320]
MILSKQKIILSVITIFLISACDNKSPTVANKNNTGDLNKYIQQVKSELVFVKGGEFLMGDYGEKYGPERLPYDSNKDSKPLHKVELSGFSINKFKTSNKLYQFYLAHNGLDNNKIKLGARNQRYWDTINSTPDTPAHVDWNDADKYCNWLAEITKMPFSLPTEAQWEFVARNRGEYVIAPTNDGTIQIRNGKGINITTADDREEQAAKIGIDLRTLSPMPGNAREPNPLGIYDMAGNGFEWMKDWYDPDYYKSSPVKDPQGPETPVFKDYKGNFTKVLRSQDFSGPGRGLTVVRNYETQNNYGRIPVDKTVRCVVNSNKPIK